MFNNHFMSFVRKYPQKVNWKFISNNKNLTSDFIKQKIGLINITEILHHESIDLKLLDEICTKFREDFTKIEWRTISERYFDFSQSETIDFVEKFAEKLDWYRLSLKNKTITKEFILKNLNQNWCWASLSFNESFDDEFIEFCAKNHIGEYSFITNSDFDFSVSTSEFIEKHKDRTNWVRLSKNYPVTLEFMETHHDRLNMRNISSNIHLTPEIIEKYFDELSIEKLVKNSAFTADLMEKYFFRIEQEVKKYNFLQKPLLLCPNITLEFIEKYFYVIDWTLLSSNHYLSLDILEKYFDKFQPEFLLSNYNLILEFIEKHKLYEINYSGGSWNNPLLWNNPLNLEPLIWKNNKKKYSQMLAKEILEEKERRQTCKSRKLHDCCVHEIKMNIRDTKNRNKQLKSRS